MNTIAIDTHKTIRNLTKKGYTEEQAEGFIEAITESDLVTQMLKMLVVQGISIIGLTVALIELLN